MYLYSTTLTLLSRLFCQLEGVIDSYTFTFLFGLCNWIGFPQASSPLAFKYLELLVFVHPSKMANQ